MAGIFISYRRQDTSAYSGRLADFLMARFGRNSTFMDLDTIRGGDDFTVVIEEKLALCDVLLAVIGPTWLATTGADAKRRLDQPGDFVRLEIARALARGVRVIPVLVGGAGMPRADQLPEDMRALSLRQAVELRDQHFRGDVERLMDLLAGVTGNGILRLWITKRTWILSIGGALLLAAALITAAVHRRVVAPVDSGKPSTIAAGQEAPSDSASTPTFAGTTTIPRPAPPRKAISLAGKWTGRVTYDWQNAIYDETFDFNVAGDEVSGTASFVGVDRGIFDGKIDADHISFLTKTQTIQGMNGSLHVDKHYYKGTLKGDTLQFSMLTDSELESHVPVYFSIHRVGSR